MIEKPRGRYSRLSKDLEAGRDCALPCKPVPPPLEAYKLLRPSNIPAANVLPSTHGLPDAQNPVRS